MNVLFFMFSIHVYVREIRVLCSKSPLEAVHLRLGVYDVTKVDLLSLYSHVEFEHVFNLFLGLFESTFYPNLNSFDGRERPMEEDNRRITSAYRFLQHPSFLCQSVSLFDLNLISIGFISQSHLVRPNKVAENRGPREQVLRGRGRYRLEIPRCRFSLLLGLARDQNIFGSIEPRVYFGRMSFDIHNQTLLSFAIHLAFFKLTFHS